MLYKVEMKVGNMKCSKILRYKFIRVVIKTSLFLLLCTVFLCSKYKYSTNNVFLKTVFKTSQ